MLEEATSFVLAALESRFVAKRTSAMDELGCAATAAAAAAAAATAAAAGMAQTLSNGVSGSLDGDLLEFWAAGEMEELGVVFQVFVSTFLLASSQTHCAASLLVP